MVEKHLICWYFHLKTARVFKVHLNAFLFFSAITTEERLIVLRFYLYSKARNSFFALSEKDYATVAASKRFYLNLGLNLKNDRANLIRAVLDHWTNRSFLMIDYDLDIFWAIWGRICVSRRHNRNDELEAIFLAFRTLHIYEPKF